MKLTVYLLIVVVIFACGMLAGRAWNQSTTAGVSAADTESVAKTTVGEPEVAKFVGQVPSQKPVSTGGSQKRRSNLRRQGDEFELGPLDACFNEKVVGRYKGQPDEHFEVTFLLTNNTEGKVLNPKIWKSVVKDNFGNLCNVEVAEGGFSQVFGGRDAVELNPNGSTTFTLRVWPAIAKATSYKGSLTFDGVENGGWSRPKIRFCIDQSTTFMEQRFEDEELEPAYIGVRQIKNLNGFDFVVEEIESVDVESDSGPNRRCYLITSKLTNLDKSKTIDPYLSIETYSHSGEQLTAWTGAVPGDESGKKLGYGQHAILKDYIEAPDGSAVLYSTLRINETYFGTDPTLIRLRISPNTIKQSNAIK